MRFVDELKNIRVVTQEEKWDDFLKEKGKVLAELIPNACRKSAKDGKCTALIRGQYICHHHKEVDFFRLSRSGIKLTKTEMGRIVKQKCEELGLKLRSIRGRYDDVGAPAFIITIEVKW